MSETKNTAQSQLATRLARVQPLRDLAHSWYALAVVCRRMGALTERAIKEILYESANNPMNENTNNDNPN